MNGFRTTLAAIAMLAGAASAMATPEVTSLSDYCVPNDATDDTTCIQTWMNQAAVGGKDLYVPPGVFLYSKPVPLYSNTHVRCAGPGASLFKNNGGSGDLFVASTSIENVIIENCAFDVNGGTGRFLAVIAINPSSTTNPYTRNIHIRGNRIFDSAIPGKSSTEQRQYIVLIHCRDCWIENNRLSEGGRIKIGRPGQRFFIRANVIENANDNAITVVDISGDASSEIVVSDNVILDPIGVGIFLGADGETRNDAKMSAFNFQVSGNQVKGDWATACILATLPARAGRIQIDRNSCTKTGKSGQYTAGISLGRVDPAALPSQQVSISSNLVTAENGVLTLGGIFVKGMHTGLRVIGNEVRHVGNPAIQFKNMDVREVLVSNNVMAGAGLVVDGAFAGVISDNLISGAQGHGIHFISEGKELIQGTLQQNAVWGASGNCISFSAKSSYLVDVVGNTLNQCGGEPIAGQPAAGSIRLHNKGDSTPHAAPTRHLSATAAWMTANIASGGKEGVDLSVAGARRGDVAAASYDAITGGDWNISAYVIANNKVRVLITNRTGASQALKGTVRVQVWKFN